MEGDSRRKVSLRETPRIRLQALVVLDRTTATVRKDF
jgi:hypothetical protein